MFKAQVELSRKAEGIIPRSLLGVYTLMAVDNVGGLETLSDPATECEIILARKNY